MISGRLGADTLELLVPESVFRVTANLLVILLSITGNLPSSLSLRQLELQSALVTSLSLALTPNKNASRESIGRLCELNPRLSRNRFDNSKFQISLPLQRSLPRSVASSLATGSGQKQRFAAALSGLLAT